MSADRPGLCLHCGLCSACKGSVGGRTAGHFAAASVPSSTPWQLLLLIEQQWRAQSVLGLGQ